jgi:anti-anti-sigma factor
MDSTGIHVLLVTKELCAEHGSQFSIVPGQSQVSRVLQITGLLGQLPTRDGRSGDDHISISAQGQA